MAGKRELIEPHKGDRGYVRRDAEGTKAIRRRDKTSYATSLVEHIT